MARSDVCGFFWDDTPPPKLPKKEKPKCVPPDPVWLSPDYLPGLEQALAARPSLFTDFELGQAAAAEERLVWDIECYPNYFLVAFKSIESGKIVYFEMGEGEALNISKLLWVLQSFVIVDFNGDKYDVPIVSIALAGRSPADLFLATYQIINGGRDARPHHVLRRFKSKRVKVNHIDLFELVALHPSLKLLAGRLHAKRMQDLPFVPGTMLSPDQIAITRWYCFNDLDNTELLYRELLPDITLREKMSVEYCIDLRSHSDAQIAEAVLSSEIAKLTGQTRLPRPTVAPGTMYRYQVPKFIQYKTELMNWVLSRVMTAWFQVGNNGSMLMPEEIKGLKIQIGDGVYRMGVGGLHSSEKRSAHIADAETVLLDRDVASYYPRIILNCLLAPVHLGAPFLKAYNRQVNDRLTAKRTGQTTIADSLKIVVNGSFGKLGSMYSVLYSPDLLIQVTITGQLALLMLIERIELLGIPVVSANTDGVIVKCPKVRQEELNTVIAQWETDTGFETEETRYTALFSRDVNNYFAVKQKRDRATGNWIAEADGCKVKGVYSERGSSRNSILAKNPTSQICSDAVEKMLTAGIPVHETIYACRDIRRFFSVRTVKGGAVKNGEYLGKAIRWYYAVGEEGHIVYAKSGNMVPRSIGAKPCMELPVEFPLDVNYEWYEVEANKILKQIGFLNDALPEDADEEDEVEEDDFEESHN